MTDKLNLIDTIAKTDMFSVFSRLLGTSGAAEALSDGGDFTVFAPTNDAFGKIPDKQMNALVQEPRQTTLRELLSYHIVPRRLLASDLCPTLAAEALTGVEVRFRDDRGLKVNDSGVQARNIEASNGVIHAIDQVLLPDL